MLDGAVGLAIAAHVVVDDLEVLRKLRRGRSEVEVTETGPVDLNHGLALSFDRVPELGASDLHPSLHRVSSYGAIVISTASGCSASARRSSAVVHFRFGSNRRRSVKRASSANGNGSMRTCQG